MSVVDQQPRADCSARKINEVPRSDAIGGEGIVDHVDFFRSRWSVFSVVVGDRDPDCLGFRTLRDRYLKNAVFVRGLDCVETYVTGKPEVPMDREVCPDVVDRGTHNSAGVFFRLSERRLLSRAGKSRHPC
jgi:hypothetical protein